MLQRIELRTNGDHLAFARVLPVPHGVVVWGSRFFVVDEGATMAEPNVMVYREVTAIAAHRDAEAG